MTAVMELREELRATLQGRVAIIGIGNPIRGDDGVGCRIARDLMAAAEALRRDVTVFDAEEIPESYLGPVVGMRPDVILLVDAADFGAEPGAAALLDAAALDGEVFATHRTPLSPVVTFLHHETRAPVFLLAVQPGSHRWGASLSEPVDASARDLTSLLLDSLVIAEPRTT